jgi:hypothetical protein
VVLGGSERFTPAGCQSLRDGRSDEVKNTLGRSDLVHIAICDGPALR